MGTTSNSESEEEVELLSTLICSVLNPTQGKGLEGAFVEAESVVHRQKSRHLFSSAQYYLSTVGLFLTFCGS